MNRVKHLAVILLVFVMCFGMCVPVFAANTLELLTQKLNAYDGNICTIKYWSPDNNYNNVLIIGTKSISYGSIDRWNLIYYKDGTTFTFLGNYKAWSASESFYYKQFKTYEEAIEALFNNESATDYATLQQFENFTYGDVYLYQEETYSAEAAASMEAAYYDWYIETYGEEPTFEATTPDDGNSGITDAETKGILNTILEYLKKLVDPISGIEIDIIIGTVDTILDDALGDNDFYISVCEIQNELTKLLAQDYSDPSGFHEVNPLIFTMRRVPIANEEGTSYTYSKVDWGIQDISLIGDMKWFFGNHYSSGKNGIGYINVDGSPAIKSYSDALISAFLWISFAFTIWHRFPDLIAGEVATIGGIFGDHLHHEAVESRRNEDMFAAKEYMTESSTIKGENGVNYTYTKKRRLK